MNKQRRQKLKNIKLALSRLGEDAKQIADEESNAIDRLTAKDSVLANKMRDARLFLYELEQKLVDLAYYIEVEEHKL